MGWQWQKNRRTDPARVERHWLVLSVATLLTLAAGSRVEDAHALKKSPGALSLGLAALNRFLAKGRMWRRVWLLPEPWPPPPDGLKVVLHPETSNLPL